MANDFENLFERLSRMTPSTGRTVRDILGPITESVEVGPDHTENMRKFIEKAK